MWKKCFFLFLPCPPSLSHSPLSTAFSICGRLGTNPQQIWGSYCISNHLYVSIKVQINETTGRYPFILLNCHLFKRLWMRNIWLETENNVSELEIIWWTKYVFWPATISGKTKFASLWSITTTCSLCIIRRDSGLNIYIKGNGGCIMQLSTLWRKKIYLQSNIIE